MDVDLRFARLHSQAPGRRHPALLALADRPPEPAARVVTVPAHALCIVTGVLAGALSVRDASGSWRRLPAWSIQGPQSMARSWRAEPGTRTVTALVHAHAIPDVSGLSAATFRDAWLPDAALDALLTWLTRETPGTRGARRDADRRAETFAALADAPSVAQATRRLALGERSLQRLCDRDAGLPPVVLGRLFRLHRCVRAGLPSGRLTADDAFAAGYSDQSHMARDFRRLAGIQPHQLAEPDSWSMRVSASRLAPAWLTGAGARLSESS